MAGDRDFDGQVLPSAERRQGRAVTGGEDKGADVIALLLSVSCIIRALLVHDSETRDCLTRQVLAIENPFNKVRGFFSLVFSVR